MTCAGEISCKPVMRVLVSFTKTCLTRNQFLMWQMPDRIWLTNI